MTPGRRPSLLSNTAAGALSTGITIAVTLGVTPVLLRELGAPQYGAWILLTVFLVQGRGLASLADLGMQQSLVARVAEVDLDVASRRCGAALRILLPVGLVAAAALGIGSPSICRAIGANADGAVVGLRLLALQLVMDIPATVLWSGLEGRRLYGVKRALEAARVVLFAGGAATSALAGSGIAALGASSLMATTVTTACALVAFRRSGLRLARGGRTGDELRSGVPLLALRLTGVGYRQLDKLVLGIVATTVGVAAFDVAEKVNLGGLTVLGVATSALIPASAAAASAGRPIADMALLATRWSGLLAGPLVGLAFGLAGPICEVVAGGSLPGASAAVRWLALTVLIATTYAAAFEMAIGVAAARRLAPMALLGLAINVVATLILASRYGASGSAAASLIATAAVAPLVVARSAAAVGASARALIVAALPGAGVAGSVAAGAALAASTGTSAEAALLRGGAAGVAVAAAGLGVPLLHAVRRWRTTPAAA